VSRDVLSGGGGDVDRPAGGAEGDVPVVRLDDEVVTRREPRARRHLRPPVLRGITRSAAALLGLLAVVLAGDVARVLLRPGAPPQLPSARGVAGTLGLAATAADSLAGGDRCRASAILGAGASRVQASDGTGTQEVVIVYADDAAAAAALQRLRASIGRGCAQFRADGLTYRWDIATDEGIRDEGLRLRFSPAAATGVDQGGSSGGGLSSLEQVIYVARHGRVVLEVNGYEDGFGGPDDVVTRMLSLAARLPA